MVTVSGLIYNLGLVVGPWFEGQLAQCLLGILNGNETFAAMAALCAGYLIAIAVVQGSRFIKRLYVRKFANNINRSMKQVLYANLVRKDKVELEQAGTGTLMTKAISDVDACAEGMRKFTTEIFDTGIALLAYAVMLLGYDWRLALLCLVFAPISYYIAEQMKTLVQRTGAANKESTGRLSAATLDRVSGALTYRVYGCEPQRDAAYEACLQDYERTAVKATSDGIVSRSLVNTGTLVSATDTLLATITQPEEMRIVFAVSERDLDGATISLDNKVRLRLDNGKTVDAKLDYVARQIDPTSASLMMRAKVPAGTPGVVPGQFVHVQLQTRVEKHAIRVPQRSVIQKPDGTYQVYVIRGDVARAVPVTVGLWKDTDWIILSGLEAGDKVVTDQIQRVRDKQPVTLVEKK